MPTGNGWWMLPLGVGWLSVACGLVGLLTSHWIVIEMVGRTTGRSCEAASVRRGALESGLLTAAFCDGDATCRIYALLLGIVGIGGVAVMGLGMVVGTWLYVAGKAYGIVFNALLFSATLLLDLVSLLWMICATSMIGLPHVDYRCSSWSFIAFGASGTFALLTLGIMHNPFLKYLSERPPKRFLALPSHTKRESDGGCSASSACAARTACAAGCHGAVCFKETGPAAS